MGYAIIEREKSWYLYFVPFILFLGGIIYAHIARKIILYSAHRAQNELDINAYAKGELLIDIESKCGLFPIENDKISKTTYLLIATFLVFGIASIIIGICSFYPYFAGNDPSGLYFVVDKALILIFLPYCIIIIILGIAMMEHWLTYKEKRDTLKQLRNSQNGTSTLKKNSKNTIYSLIGFIIELISMGIFFYLFFNGIFHFSYFPLIYLLFLVSSIMSVISILIGYYTLTSSLKNEFSKISILFGSITVSLLYLLIIKIYYFSS